MPGYESNARQALRCHSEVAGKHGLVVKGPIHADQLGAPDRLILQLQDASFDVRAVLDVVVAALGEAVGVRGLRHRHTDSARLGIGLMTRIFESRHQALLGDLA